MCDFIKYLGNHRSEARLPPFGVVTADNPTSLTWRLYNMGPGEAAFYCGTPGGRACEVSKLLPHHQVEFTAAKIVVQSRDSLGAVILIATA
jgi:hypothetical protein